MKRYRDIRIETIGSGAMQEAMANAVQETQEVSDDEDEGEELISFEDNLNLDEMDLDIDI